MNKQRNCRFVVLIIALTIAFSSGFAVDDTLEILSPNYFDEQDNVFDEIHYLKNEHLTFNFCTDINSSNIQFELVCEIEDNTEIQVVKHTEREGCFFSNYELDAVNCDDFDLLITYQTDNKDRKIKRSFTKQQESKLINYVLSLDYNLLTPIDLSYYLIVLNNIHDTDSRISRESYDKLKNDRDNTNKCWKSGACVIADTAKILRNLKLAEYDLNTRLLDDGRNYLEKNLINNENNPQRFIIEVDDSFSDLDYEDGVLCDLQVDDESEKSYLFALNYTSHESYASESIDFSCNQTVQEINFRLFSIENTTQINEDFDDETGFTQSLDAYSCVGKNVDCDYSSTIDSLNAYGTKIETASLLGNYIDSLVSEETDGTKFLDVPVPYTATGKFLYYKSQDDLEDYIKFEQNNDGSWGRNSRYDRLDQTAWAVLGLQEADSATSEYVRDGKDWIYYNEPETGWGSVEKNTMAYLAIKEQIKPYLKMNVLNEVSRTAFFELENPTIFNLRDVKVVLSDEIADSVSYTENLGDIEGEEITKFNITVNENFVGTQTGTITITGFDGKENEITLTSFQVNLRGPLPISILGGNFSVTQDDPLIRLDFEKNLPKFSLECNYDNPFSKKEASFKLNEKSKSISIDNSALIDGNFSFYMSCTFGEEKFDLPVSISVDIAQSSFIPEVSVINLTTLDNFSIAITSTATDKQLLTFDLDGDYKNLIAPAEEGKIIAAGDTRDIFMNIENPIFLEALGNTTKGNLILKSDTGYVKKVPIVMSLGSESQDEGGSIWGLVLTILLILFIAFLAFVGFRIYQYRQYEEEQAQYDQEDDDLYFE